MNPSVVAGFVPWDSDGATLDVRTTGARAMIASVLCYAAVCYRRDKVAEAPLYVADETSSGEPWLPNHFLAALLEQPNPDQEMADLLMETQQTMDLDRGMALWLIERDRTNRPARLRCYGGTEFSVHRANGRIYGLFRIQTEQGMIERGPEDVVFFRYPHPHDRWDGLSPTQVVGKHLGIETELVESVRAGLRNNIVPGLIITRADSLTREQRQEYVASLREQYAAARNHGKPLALEGGATAEQNKLGFKDLAGGDLYKEIEAAVCIAYKVRPEVLAFMIGLENAPWSHMKTAQQMGYDETIIPLQTAFERGITRQLLRPADPDRSRVVRFDRSKVRALEPDLERRARVQLLVRDIATPNQRRQMVGMEPMAGAWWNSPPENARAAEAVPKTSPRGRGLAAKGQSGDATRWAVFDAAARAAEFGWVLAAGAQLEADREALVALAERVLRRSRKEEVAPVDPETVRALARAAEAHFSDQSAVAWRGRAEPLIRAGARQAVQRAANDLSVSFDLAIPGVDTFTEREAAWLVDGLTRTTRTAVAEALADGIDAGESVPQLTARLRDLGAFSRSRAELIARTESTRVANGAALEGMRAYAAASGERVTKRWLTAQDASVRDEHAALDDEARGLDEEFSNGLQHPGEPNCRCTLVYSMEDAA